MKSIYHAAIESGILKTWVAAIEVVGLVDLLKSDDYFTVFAPSDDAFKKLPRHHVEDLLGDLENLIANICNHMVPGKILTREMTELNSMRTLMKNELLIEAGREMFISDARLIVPNVECRNGVIHIVDTVLLIRKHRKVRIGDIRCRTLAHPE